MAFGAVEGPRQPGGAADEFLLDRVGGLVGLRPLLDLGLEQRGVLVGRTRSMDLARMPCFSALYRAFCFPASVFGPQLFLAFSRLARIWASVGMGRVPV